MKDFHASDNGFYSFASATAGRIHTDMGFKLCDMHSHSNFSDGTLSPEMLVGLAKREGISAIALCDHNTVAGIPSFFKAAQGTSVDAVSGVEITSCYNGRETHILGLFLKKDSLGEIAEFLKTVNRYKEEGNLELARRLSLGGYEIDYTEIKKASGDQIPNRVHFARALIAKGYISSVKEAFDGILSDSGGFYISAEKLCSFDVISFLREIGALPILAHPLLTLSFEETREFLKKAKSCGLMGLEAIYSLFSAEETEKLYSLASEFKLAVSGGSDFHGDNKPNIKLGVGKGNIKIPYTIYEHLKELSESI